MAEYVPIIWIISGLKYIIDDNNLSSKLSIFRSRSEIVTGSRAWCTP
jgi:hypothetical protein